MKESLPFKSSKSYWAKVTWSEQSYDVKNDLAVAKQPSASQHFYCKSIVALFTKPELISLIQSLFQWSFIYWVEFRETDLMPSTKTPVKIVYNSVWSKKACRFSVCGISVCAKFCAEMVWIGKLFVSPDIPALGMSVLREEYWTSLKFE